MSRYREILLIVAYVLLIFVVTFGAFFIDDKFSSAHDEQCEVAQAQVEVAAVQLTVTLRGQTATEQDKAIVNDAIARLNRTCDLHLSPIG